MRNRPNLYGRLDVTFSGSSDRWRRRRRDRSGNRQRGDGRHRRSGNEGKDQRELKGIRGRFVSKEEPAKAFTYHSVSLVSVPVPAIRQCVSHLKLLYHWKRFFHASRFLQHFVAFLCPFDKICASCKFSLNTATVFQRYSALFSRNSRSVCVLTVRGAPCHSRTGSEPTPEVPCHTGRGEAGK